VQATTSRSGPTPRSWCSRPSCTSVGTMSTACIAQPCASSISPPLASASRCSRPTHPSSRYARHLLHGRVRLWETPQGLSCRSEAGNATTPSRPPTGEKKQRSVLRMCVMRHGTVELRAEPARRGPARALCWAPERAPTRETPSPARALHSAAATEPCLRAS
jgi:hypothetical protein